MTCCQYTSFGLENCNSVCECKGVSIPSKISIAKAPWKEIWSCWLANIVYYNSMAILSKHHLYWCWRNLQRCFYWTHWIEETPLKLSKDKLAALHCNMTWLIPFQLLFHQKSKLCLIKQHGPTLSWFAHLWLQYEKWQWKVETCPQLKSENIESNSSVPRFRECRENAIWA